MVKHSQLIICVKAIYFSLLSSSFLVPIVAAKWKMCEFFKLTTDSCSRTFLTKSRGRRRLKGMLIASLLTEVCLPGLKASLRLCRWGWPPFFWWSWTECPRQHCQRLLQDQSPFLWELLWNWTSAVQPLPELHHTKSASLRFMPSHSHAQPCMRLIRTPNLQLTYQPSHSPASSPWLCPAITGLCLTLGTLTRTDPDPDVLAWPQPISPPFPGPCLAIPGPCLALGTLTRPDPDCHFLLCGAWTQSYQGLRCTLMLEQNNNNKKVNIWLYTWWSVCWGKLPALISKRRCLPSILVGLGPCERGVEIVWLICLTRKSQADHDQSLVAC